MFAAAALKFILVGYLAAVGHSARVDVRNGAQDAQAHTEAESNREVEQPEQLHRYRALNESEMRRWLAGENLPLIASSFQEEDVTDVRLPAEWRSKLRVVKKLGEGSFGKVFQCKVLCETYKDISVSVKLIVKKTPEVLDEIKILKRMRGVSDFCISAVGDPAFVDNADGYWIMMPYMNGGELHDLLQRCQRNAKCLYSITHGRKDWTQLHPSFTTPYMLGLFHDIVLGTKALHETAGLHHIDLKPANVMMNCEGDKCFAAVIDLGLACKPSECGLSGTPLYIPPEVYRQSRRGMTHPGRDIWALGIILYELMYYQLPPFFKDPFHQVALYDAEFDLNIPMNAGMQEALHLKKIDILVKSMMNKDYTQRPSLSKISTALQDIVLSWRPLDVNAGQMLSQSPSERGASAATPTCLEKPHVQGDAFPRSHYVPVYEYDLATTTTTTALVRRIYRPSHQPARQIHYDREPVYQAQPAPERQINYQNVFFAGSGHPAPNGLRLGLLGGGGGGYNPPRHAQPEPPRGRVLPNGLRLLGGYRPSLLETTADEEPREPQSLEQFQAMLHTEDASE